MDSTPKRKYKPSTIIHVGQDKPVSDKARHYVDKADFYNELVIRKAQWEEYHRLLETDKPINVPRISEKVGDYIIKICNNLSKKHNFAHLPFRDIMVSCAIEQCCKKVDQFNTEVTQNPFSYFTQVAFYAFLDYIKEEEEIQAVQLRELLNSMALQEYLEHDESQNAEHIHDNFEVPDLEYARNYVGNFETKKQLKAKLQKQKQQEKTQSNTDFWE